MSHSKLILISILFIDSMTTVFAISFFSGFPVIAQNNNNDMSKEESKRQQKKQ